MKCGIAEQPERKVISKEIGPGVRFHAITGEPRFKTDLLTVRFYLPAERENAAELALLPAVLTHGCRCYPTAEALSEQLDSLYNTELNAKTAAFCQTKVMIFSLRVLERECVPDREDIFLKALSLLSSVLFDPLLEDGAFSGAYVETERRNLADNIRASEKRKSALAARIASQALWKGDARCYPPSGTAEEAEKVTPESLIACYRALLSGARAECWYFGKRDAEETASAVCAMLAPLIEVRTPDDTFSPLPQLAAPKRGKGVRYLRRTLPVRQSYLLLVHTTDVLRDSKDYPAFVVFDMLLGAGPDSLLFRRLREEKGLCYECFSAYYGNSGIWTVSCGIDARSRTAAERCIGQLLSETAAGGFTDEELNDARRAVLNSVRMQEDYPASVCERYARLCALGSDPSVKKTADAVEAVSRADIMRAAAAAKKRLSVFICGTKRGSGEITDGGEEDADGDEA